MLINRALPEKICARREGVPKSFHQDSIAVLKTCRGSGWVRWQGRIPDQKAGNKKNSIILSGFKYGIVRYDQDTAMIPARAFLSIIKSVSNPWVRIFFIKNLVAPLFSGPGCRILSIAPGDIFREAGNG